MRAPHTYSPPTLSPCCTSVYMNNVYRTTYKMNIVYMNNVYMFPFQLVDIPSDLGFPCFLGHLYAAAPPKSDQKLEHGLMTKALA